MSGGRCGVIHLHSTLPGVEGERTRSREIDSLPGRWRASFALTAYCTRDGGNDEFRSTLPHIYIHCRPFASCLASNEVSIALPLELRKDIFLRQISQPVAFS